MCFRFDNRKNPYLLRETTYLGRDTQLVYHGHVLGMKSGPIPRQTSGQLTELRIVGIQHAPALNLVDQSPHLRRTPLPDLLVMH